MKSNLFAAVAVVTASIVSFHAPALSQGLGGGYDQFADEADSEAMALIALEKEVASSIEDLLNPSCVSDAECTAAPFGSRACGGPESFVIYSNKNTDEGKLLPLLNQHVVVQNELNRRLGIASICALEMPPAKLVCRQNTCAAE